MLIEPMYPLPCVICKKHLEPISEGEWTQPLRAVTLTGYGHYGSVFDTTSVMVNICDTCLNERLGFALSFEPSREPQPMTYFTINDRTI